MHSEKRNEVSDISLSINNVNEYLSGKRWSYMIYSSFFPLGWIYSDCCGRICKWLGMSNEGQWGELRSAATCGTLWSWAVEEAELELLKLIFLSELSEARYPSQGSRAAESSCSALFGQKMQVLHPNHSSLPPQQSVLWAGLGQVGGDSLHSPLCSLFTEMNRSCKIKLKSQKSSFYCCYPGPRGWGNQRASIPQPWLAAAPA